MRILYFGSGAFGIPTLAALAQSHDVVGVVTQPDRPAGRGGRLTPTPVAQWAAEHLHAVPVFKPERVREASIVAQLRDLAGPGKADAWVVIAFGQKLPAALLEGVYAVNLHASLLPRWRGAAPINAAILAGDAETGNSVITLADRMDAGRILAQSRRPIDTLVTAGELHDLLAADGPALVLHVLDDLAKGGVSGRVQDESAVTVAGKLTKSLGEIRFEAGADECRRRIHALNPWPAVTAQFQGTPLKLLRAAEEPRRHAEPAAGVLIDPAEGLIACGGGTTLRLLEVQPAGKKPMKWADFARGRRIAPGERLTSGPGDDPENPQPEKPRC